VSIPSSDAALRACQDRRELSMAAVSDELPYISRYIGMLNFVKVILQMLVGADMVTATPCCVAQKRTK
jgi:hypothetical protein